MDERRNEPGSAGLLCVSCISCSASWALPGNQGMHSTKPGVSVYGDFRCVLMDYQGKIFLDIPGNNPIPTPGPFRILIRRATRRQRLFWKDNHTRHTCEMLDKILCLFQILKQILRQFFPAAGIISSKEYPQFFCNMTKALFAQKLSKTPFVGFWIIIRHVFLTEWFAKKIKTENARGNKNCGTGLHSNGK